MYIHAQRRAYTYNASVYKHSKQECCDAMLLCNNVYMYNTLFSNTLIVEVAFLSLDRRIWLDFLDVRCLFVCLFYLSLNTFGYKIHTYTHALQHTVFWSAAIGKEEISKQKIAWCFDWKLEEFEKNQIYFMLLKSFKRWFVIRPHDDRNKSISA